MHRPTEPEYYGAVKFVLSDHQWQYRGEGNAHIAISLPLEKKVILLPKVDRNHAPDTLESWHTMRTNIAFISSVMESLMGKQFVSCPSLIYLECDDIALLNRALASVRPGNRLHKIILFCGGELFDDFAFLPKEMSVLSQAKTISVELKPKQGIFPAIERKKRNCLFCSKQLLKLKDGIISKRSEYCPLNLFSGCVIRMEHALKALINSPQNNLRIFCNGDLVYGEGLSSDFLERALASWLQPTSGSTFTERFCSLLLQALTKDMSCSFTPSQKKCQNWIYDGLSQSFTNTAGSKEDDTPEILQNIHQPPCNYDRQNLPQGSILHAIAQAQALDLCGLSEVLNMVKHHDDLSHESNQEIEMGIEYVQDVIDKGCSSRLNAIELYLIASVVRDCSILIALQEIPESISESCSWPQIEDTLTKTRYMVKISALDINPKCFSTITSHVSRNQKILEAILN